VEHEALYDLRLKSAQSTCQLCDRLQRISAVHTQAFVTNFRITQHVDKSSRAIQAKDDRPPHPGINPRCKCYKRTFRSAHIEVGYYQCNGNWLIRPRTKGISGGGETFIQTLWHGSVASDCRADSNNGVRRLAGCVKMETAVRSSPELVLPIHRSRRQPPPRGVDRGYMCLIRQRHAFQPLWLRQSRPSCPPLPSS
jgi:hypothetical protein